MDNYKQSSPPIIPILLGASIGAAAGLLLAPQPGVVTRQKLIEKGQIGLLSLFIEQQLFFGG